MNVSGSAKKTIVEVRNLKVNFSTYRGEVKALNGVDLKLHEREVLGLVGESGCGKSVTALTLLGLLPENAHVLDGEILLKGENLLEKTTEERRILRITELATVFQDPATYLNPVLKIETQLKEVFLLNKELLKQLVTWQKTRRSEVKFADVLSRKLSLPSGLSGTSVPKREIQKMARSLCVDLLRLVKMPDPERILRQYPFELSGGMRQRVMIAMALARTPSVFVADEITTAVDVTIQAQILHLLRELRDKMKAAILMITHDLSVAAEISDRIAVMYGGNIVEVAPTREIFRNPRHPYTVMLMKAIPNVKRPVKRLASIPGTVPEMINPPSGCRFHPRCPLAGETCDEGTPRLKQVAENHLVACF